MKIAFYAPMKPPDHPVPSGDRAIARGLVHAMRLAGHHVRVASRLRTYDREGERAVQERHRAAGQRAAARLLSAYAAGGAPDVWFTYHLHHKAPDCVGPPVTRALGIPYLVAEASIAPKQADGRWALGYAIALDAIRHADTVLFLNPGDVATVRAARPPDAPSVTFPPFVDVARFCASPDAPLDDDAPVRLVTVAMMRDGSKLASYRLLATALSRLADLSFQLTIVGDGAARSEVVRAFTPIAGRVAFRGALAPDGVAAVLRRSDVFVWPAIDEAIGMAFLEAQACALPVVAGYTPGVATVVAHGRSGFVVPAGDVDAFAASVRTVIGDRRLRESLRHGALAYVRAHHDVHAAAARLDAILRERLSSPPLPGQAAQRAPGPARAPSPALP